ncbi:MAG: adenosylcobinamide-GDP ribazoletransferase [Gammaproteobacteria bacterium]
MRPFLIALQFLTRLPVSLRESPDDHDIGQSVLYYPLVGLLLGLLLAALAWAMGDRSTLLRAACLLAAWVLLTGGLHLDGLADSADAWAGGLGNRERTLAIMKDPHCGPVAVVVLLVLLLLKLASLEALAAQREALPLVLAPLIGRTALLALFLSTPYVRSGGLGEVLARELPRQPTVIVVLSAVAAILLIMGRDGAWLLASVCITFTALRVLMLRRLGGTTGDTAGAMVELVESSVLMTAAMV